MLSILCTLTGCVKMDQPVSKNSEDTIKIEVATNTTEAMFEEAVEECLEDDEQSLHLLDSYEGELFVSYTGLSTSAGGADSLYFDQQLVTRDGVLVVDAKYGSIELVEDSFGYPMWICQFFARFGDFNYGLVVAKDGSWSHHFHRANISMEGKYLKVENSVNYETEKYYKVGTYLTEVPESVVEELEIVECDTGYDRAQLWLYDCGYNYDWGNFIYEESKEKQYLLDEKLQPILQGDKLDQIKDSNTSEVCYYTAFDKNQLKLYDSNAEWIADLEGTAVLGICNGKVYSVAIEYIGDTSQEVFVYQMKK